MSAKDGDDRGSQAGDHTVSWDLIQELEAANRADPEEMAKLQELAKDGSPGYLVDNRGLLRISNEVYIQKTP